MLFKIYILGFINGKCYKSYVKASLKAPEVEPNGAKYSRSHHENKNGGQWKRWERNAHDFSANTAIIWSSKGWHYKNNVWWWAKTKAWALTWWNMVLLKGIAFKIKSAWILLKIEYHAVGDTWLKRLMTTTAVLWQMMYWIKDWFIHLLILSIVYEHDKQKTIVYWSDQFKIEESKQNETFYFNSWFKCCTQKNLAWWPIFFSAYFMLVYVSFIIVRNCGFIIAFVILAIHFWLKTTIFNLKT